MNEYHEKMVNAAVWLAEQGIARIGWAAVGEGKAAGSRTGHRWQDDATDDPAAVRAMLTGGRNSLVIPKERGLLIDNDDDAAWSELAAAGLPPTFTVDSPTPGHGHVYGKVPEGIDMTTIPGTFEHGELRRFDPRTNTSSMVLGPWAQLPDGRTYRPRNGIRQVATLPRSVIEYLVESDRRKRSAEGTAKGPTDDGWFVEKGRHDFLVRRARHVRGVGLTGERLLEELKRLDTERCRPPLASEPGRGLAEIERIAGWTEGRIGDDPPPTTINTNAPAELAEKRFPEPEDFGLAQPSPLANVEYVGDFIRPGRLVTWAAEEGSGKSFAVDAELAVRVALTGGSFAETWPVLRQGPVLVLSEMHADDDIGRLERVCGALQRHRSELEGRYYRLPLYAAAGGEPCLAVPEWRRYIVDWCRERGVLLAVFDTATGAVDVDPWGREIQRLFRDLRTMLAEYPELAIVLIVHLKKPSGRGVRRLSDVLGEWGRWNDVTVLMEADGLEQVRLEVRKRVTRERRIVVTKRDGLLVDPREPQAGGPKVPQDRFLAAVAAAPGSSAAELAAQLGVTEKTLRGYAKAAGSGVVTEETKLKGAARRVAYFPATTVTTVDDGNEHVTAVTTGATGGVGAVYDGNRKPPYIEGGSVTVVEPAADGDLTAAARAVFGNMLKEGKA